MIYLYVKTHNKTGLKYFGKTIAKDPMKYKGSGTAWRRHIKKHGYDVTTEIIGMFEDTNECKKIAIDFSSNNNIVNSKEWANLKIEELDGGWNHINSLSKKHRKENWFKWWNSLTEEERSNINKLKSQPNEKNPMFGVDRSGENNPRYGQKNSAGTRQKISEANKNKMVVKDKETGKTIGLIDKDHENIKSGKWVSINIGNTFSEEFKKKRSEDYKLKGIKPPSPKGLLWWNNGKMTLRSKTNPGNGFVRGRGKLK